MDINALTKLSYGLYIVTTKYEDTFSGCIVNTVVPSYTRKNLKK